jgi:hypothetical protein
MLALTTAVVSVSTAAGAQQVSINQQYMGICSGLPLTSYSGWLAIATGMTCHNAPPGDLNGLFTTVRSTGTLDWSFVDGPVDFKGLYFTGNGTFYLDLMDGDKVIHTRMFTAYGSNVFIGTPEFSGSVGRIRIRRESGVGAFGLGEGGLVGGGPAPPNQGGSGPPGNGPDGNGPPGNGPDGSGPPGNGPTGPEGNDPNGNGGGGPATNNSPESGNPGDDVENLVNEPNATPEPATILLVATGLGGVGALVRRRRKAADRQPD